MKGLGAHCFLGKQITLQAGADTESDASFSLFLPLTIQPDIVENLAVHMLVGLFNNNQSPFG